MLPRALLLLTVGLLLGADAPADPAVKDVEKALRALNDAFGKRDATAVAKLVAPNHTAITSYYNGVQDKAEQLRTLPDLKMSEYGMGTPRITLLNKETALVTYPLTLKGTYKGKPLPAKNYASAIWVLQGGQWLEAFYQETPLDGK